MPPEITFNPLDRHFAQLIHDLASKPSEELALAAKLVSFYGNEGHICLPLETVAGRNQPFEGFPAEICGTPPLDTWTAKLKSSSVVGAPNEFAPLILDHKNRLYLRRYWDYEQQLVREILERAQKTAEVDFTFLQSGLDRLFPSVTTEPPESGTPARTDWQQLAAATAITKNFCVISGGPGTGKTRTVVVILALLLEQARAQNKELKIALCAPTGKAAARLQESIQKNKSSLSLSPEIADRIPVEAGTIHRLLGSIPASPYFRHHQKRKLLVDVVIVDEASMVDLALMAKLFDAIPTAARVVLLGDKDQLSSVEAGAVLGDICNSGSKAKSAPLSDCIVELKKNYRFGQDSGIYRLSQAVNAGEAKEAFTFLQSAEANDLQWKKLPRAAALKRELKNVVLQNFSSCLQTIDPESALASLNNFRILCAVKQGPFGVAGVNKVVEEILAEAGLIAEEGRWYRGRPIIITRNDYNLRLFNGDVGIILPGESGGESRAWFQSADGALRQFLTPRLPNHETVYAMTVHKSQGSEFKKLLMILPERDSPVLTRELIYTGLTRAREHVELWAEEAVTRTAMARRIERTSGLRDALWENEKRT